MHPVLVDMLRIANYNPMGFYPASFGSAESTQEEKGIYIQVCTSTHKSVLNLRHQAVYMYVLLGKVFLTYCTSFLLRIYYCFRSFPADRVANICGWNSDNFSIVTSVNTICSKSIFSRVKSRKKSVMECITEQGHSNHNAPKPYENGTD